MPDDTKPSFVLTGGGLPDVDLDAGRAGVEEGTGMVGAGWMRRAQDAEAEVEWLRGVITRMMAVPASERRRMKQLGREALARGEKRQ